jgi:uncharacterized protein
MKSFTKSDKIVLDTNIIISTLIAKHGDPAGIFKKMISGELKNYTSKEIIEEIIDVLNREEITKRTLKKDRQYILEQYLIYSIPVEPRKKFDVIEDKKDNKFIDTAKEANAKYIISGDKLVLKIKEFQGIKIIRAKEYLDELK